MELRPHPAELSTVRQFVTDWATSNGLSEAEAFEAQLIATEAVGNAVLHGSPGVEDPIEVVCKADENTLRIEVRDRGEFLPGDDTRGDTGGRGLGIIRALTRRFQLETGDEGTRLEMDLRTRAA